jgi:O-antigen biosynthesis protein
MSAAPKILNPQELGDHLTAEAPVAVRVIDLDQGEERLRLSPSRTGQPYRLLLAMLRRAGRPLGWTALPVPSDGEVALSPLRDSNAAGPGDDRDGSGGTPLPAGSQDLLSIVIATCANPGMTISCVKSILSAVREPFEIVVVENRPDGSTVAAALAAAFPGEERVRYVEERRPGLSSARNAGLAAARGELVAFTDDDVHVDACWDSAVRAAFAASPASDCVTGLILPRELETPAQLLDERFASFGKGFDSRTYSLDQPPPDQPLFPYTAGYFGSGANMTFRTAAIRDLGGFDRALGTGTLARGGEDLDICIRLLHSGRKLTYEPAAMVWHRHPDTFAAVRRQVFGYGVGLGAMLAKHVVVGPNRWAVVSRSAQGIRYYTDPESRKNALRGPSFPRRLVRLERTGLLLGPFAYLASRVRQSR